MKIYRLLECSGGNDKYSEIRIGTYLSKEKAKLMKKEQEELDKQAEEQAILCDQCRDSDNICKQLCFSFKASKVNKNECVNWSNYWEPRIYRIDEEEVIE